MTTKTLALALGLALGAATTVPGAHAAETVPAAPAATKPHGSAAANKALVLKAYQALFGDHDLSAVDAEGDLVFVQTRQPKLGDSPEMVIVDIFRVEKGKLAEHWDVMQAVPADALNKRPMY